MVLKYDGALQITQYNDQTSAALDFSILRVLSVFTARYAIQCMQKKAFVNTELLCFMKTNHHDHV